MCVFVFYLIYYFILNKMEKIKPNELFSDLHDAIGDRSDEFSQASSEDSHVNVSFDVDYLTEADVELSTVFFFVEKVAPRLGQGLPIENFLRSMLQFPHLNSIIKIACDSPEEGEMQSDNLIEEDDKIAGVVATAPLSNVPHQNFQPVCDIVSILKNECAAHAAQALSEVCSTSNRPIYLLVNERAPYIPNEVGAQVLVQILEKIRESDELPTLIFFAKVLFVDDSTDEPTVKRKKASEQKKSPVDRSVQFIKPEEEAFVPFQNGIRKSGDGFVLPSEVETITFDKEYEEQSKEEIPIAVPLLIDLSAMHTFGSESKKVIDWLISGLSAYA